MKSKLIIGIPLSLIAMVMVYNYFNSPPVGFKNIRGFYLAEGAPYSGCVRLLQPGAGIKVSGFFGGKETESPDLTGEVKGNKFIFAYSTSQTSGNATLTVTPASLAGEWNNGEDKGAWVFTKTAQDCS